MSEGKGRKDKTTIKSTEEGPTKRAMASEALTLAMMTELEKNCTNIREEMTTLIKTSLSPIRTTLDSVKLKVESSEAHFSKAEAALSHHSDKITILEADIVELKNTMLDLKKKSNNLRDLLDGYENQARRLNLCVIGIRENSERGQSPLKSMFWLKCWTTKAFPNRQSWKDVTGH